MDYRLDTQPDRSRNLKLYKRIVPKVRYKRYPFVIGIKNGFNSSTLKELERTTGIQNLTYESHKIVKKRYYEELQYEKVDNRVPLPPVDKFEPNLWIEYVAFKSLEAVNKNDIVSIWGLKVYPHEAVNIISHMIINSNFFTNKNNASHYSPEFNNSILQGYPIDAIKCAVVCSFFLECKSHICGIEKLLDDTLDLIDSGFLSGSLWNIPGKVHLSKLEIFTQMNKSPVVWNWLFQYIRRFANESVFNLFVKKSKLTKHIECWNISLVYFIEVAIRRPLDNGHYDNAYSAIDCFVRHVFYPNNGKSIKPGKSLTSENIYMLASLSSLSNSHNIVREIINSILEIVDTIDSVSYEFKEMHMNTFQDFSNFPSEIATFTIVDSILLYNNNLSLLLLIALLISSNVENKSIWKKLLSLVQSEKTAKKIFKLKSITEDSEMWIAYAQNPHTPYLKRRIIFKNYLKNTQDSLLFNIVNRGRLLEIIKYFKDILKEFTPSPWNNWKLSQLLTELIKRWVRTCGDGSLTFPFLEIAKISVGQTDENIILSFLKHCNLHSSDAHLFNNISKSHKETQLLLFNYLLEDSSEDELLKKVDEIINYGIQVDTDDLLQKIALLDNEN